MLTDLEIAQQATIWPIEKIAETIGLKPEDLDLYGRYKAKIHWQDIKKAPQEGKLILVTAINPTKAGEGKSTTTIGLADALNALGKKTMVALREPSFGPVMGIKGGAAGGGYAQVIPMEDINLHFTGDFHAITAANNAIAAMIDNHLHQGNSLRIDPTRIVWHRCLDLNDRALRHVVVGLGGSANGVPREDHFDISVASEIMAVLCLSTSVEDFRSRISRMVVAYTYDRRPVTVDDIQATGIVTLIMKDALMPNLVQTLEHTPALVHGGPFANIAHGCNSVIATKTALNLADYVVTEAGFGADLGAEKFLDIKCPTASLKPSCVVIVATVRALKMHGGMNKEELENENVEALLKGTENLKKHIENIRKYHVPYVIAVNRFPTDTIAELNTLAEWAEQQGHPYALSDVFCLGSQGGLELAEQVLKQIQDHDGVSTFQSLYSYEETVKQKIKTICRQIYGADAVTFTKEANSQLLLLKKNGWDHLPVCIAKTPYSLSDNAKLYGRPENFQITIRELRPSIGAGFIVVLAGDIMTMPGLPEEPAANHMDYVDGKVVGLF